MGQNLIKKSSGNPLRNRSFGPQIGWTASEEDK